MCISLDGGCESCFIEAAAVTEAIVRMPRRFEAELAVIDSRAWRTVGTSEQVILEAGQLQFGRSFEVQFAFGAEQRLRVTVRAVDPANTDGEELGAGSKSS